MKKILLMAIIGAAVFITFPVLAAGKSAPLKTVYFYKTKPAAIAGKMTYNISGSTFNFTFTGKAPSANNWYALVVGKHPKNHPETAVILDYPRSDGNTGDITISKSIELNRDLKNVKVWLVLGSDLLLLPHYDGYTGWSGWQPQYYLFGANLVNYNDTDIP